MAILLVLIYVMYIGLGLPDSLFGPSWPAMHPDIGATIGQANYITVVIYLVSAVTSFYSGKIIAKLGVSRVTVLSTALTAVGIIGFALSSSLWLTCFFAIFLGAGAGAIDSALNNYVALHYKPRHMNFLHAFYGVGVIISPYILSQTLFENGGWRTGYFIVFILQVIIVICSVIAIPLWKKTEKPINRELKKPKALSLRQMAKVPAVDFVWVVFFSSVALEFVCGIWGSTYLVEAEGLSESTGALYMTLYYVGITVGRFVSGLLSNKVKELSIISVGHGLVLIGILAMFLPIDPAYKIACFLLIGLGNGPTFPNLTCLVPKHFGEEASQSIVGTVMVSCNLAICVVPPVFGFFADTVGLHVFPYFILCLYVVMIAFGIAYRKSKKPTDGTVEFKI